MLDINYHHLLYFWTCVRAGRITSAARELHLSQSALSVQLKALERSLGRQLVIRARSGLELTPDGRLVFQHCERIFAAGAALRRELRAPRPAAPLRLAVTAGLGRDAVLAALTILAELPGTVVSVFVGPGEAVRERLRTRRLDIALAGADFSPELGTPFRSSLVDTFDVALVASPVLARRLRPFPRRGLEVPMLLRTPDDPMREQVMRWLRERGMRPFAAAETDDADLLQELAARGQGVAALPAPLVRGALGSRRLARLAPASGLAHQVWVNWPDVGIDGPVRRFLLRLRSLRARLRGGTRSAGDIVTRSSRGAGAKCPRITP